MIEYVIEYKDMNNDINTIYIYANDNAEALIKAIQDLKKLGVENLCGIEIVAFR